MLRNLQLLNIDNPSIAVLLGGGNFSEEKQNKIGDIVSTYLCETGRLGDLWKTVSDTYNKAHIATAKRDNF